MDCRPVVFSDLRAVRSEECMEDDDSDRRLKSSNSLAAVCTVGSLLQGYDVLHNMIVSGDIIGSFVTLILTAATIYFYREQI
jgi:hypothetical protein